MKPTEYRIEFHLRVTSGALGGVIDAVSARQVEFPQLLVDADGEVADGLARVQAASANAASARFQRMIAEAAAAATATPELQMSDPTPTAWKSWPAT